MRHRIEMGLAALALAGTLASKPVKAQEVTPDIAQPNSEVCTITDAGMTEGVPFTRITRYKIGIKPPVEGSFRSDSETVTRDSSGHIKDVKTERTIIHAKTGEGRTWDGKSPLGFKFEAPASFIKFLNKECNQPGSEAASLTKGAYTFPDGVAFVTLRRKPEAPVRPGQIGSPEPKREIPLFVPQRRPTTVLGT